MISSLNNERIKALIKLKQKKYRIQEGAFLVEGKTNVLTAIKEGRCQLLIYTTDDLAFLGDKLQVSQAVYQKIADIAFEDGLLALVKFNRPKALGKHLLLLENISDPGNLGNLFRSALAFGFNDVILDGGVDPYNPKVVRASMGAILNLNLIFSNLSTFIKDNPDYTYFATSVKNGDMLENQDKPQLKTALILGNEAKGISEAILTQATKIITIKTEKVESLNVAVAGGILMHYLNRLS